MNSNPLNVVAAGDPRNADSKLELETNTQIKAAPKHENG